MNRLHQLFDTKRSHILNIYVTAGFPSLESTEHILMELQKQDVDIVELGIPYSDPLADGRTIQMSSSQALKNGVDLKYIFTTIENSRKKGFKLPVVLMGYYNQMLQFGEEAFLNQCRSTGIDGLIIPDLPMSIYEKKYMHLFKQYNLGVSFLVTPDTTEKRIRQADRLSDGFIYVVSQSSITGKTSDISASQKAYFNKIKALHLATPQLIGFGIHDNHTYTSACAHANGAIIGSAFIRHLDQHGYEGDSIHKFISTIR